MFRIINVFKIFMLLCLGLQSCTQIDDYWLGKDNTPTPQALGQFKNKVNFKLAWQVPLSGGKLRDVEGKLVPVVKGQTLYIALPNGHIEARNIKNGALRWSKVFSQGLMSGPAVNDGIVALGTNASSVVALKQQTGEVLWEKRLSGQILSKPVVSNGIVLAKTVEGNLYALNKEDGHRLWKAFHGSPELILKASSSPLVLDKQFVFVGFSDGKADVYELKTGRLMWQKGIAYANGASDVERLVDIDADPLAYGNLVLLAAYQGDVGAISLNNGEFAWHKPASVYKNMALKSGQLFFVDEHDVIWAIDPTNGQVYWKQNALVARGLTSPVWVKEGVMVADKLGFIHLLSARNGSIIGRTSVDAGVRISPVASGNQIFVVTQSGQLYSFVTTRIAG